MKIFISYSRSDNDDRRLIEIEKLASLLGTPYLDDLHFDPEADRHEHVMTAMNTADAFLAVITKNYLRTDWTKRELRIAENLGIAIYKIEADVISPSTPTEVRALCASP